VIFRLVFLFLLLPSISFAGFSVSGVATPTSVSGVTAPASVSGVTSSYSPPPGCSYPTKDSQATDSDYESYQDKYSAWHFQATATYTLVRLTLKLYRSAGTPTSTVQVMMWADSSGAPGTALGTSTTSMSASSISTDTGGTDYDFDFSGVSISSGTKYFFGLYASDTSIAIYYKVNTTGGGTDSYWYGATSPPGYVLLDNVQAVFVGASCN
jgi:hypothetical protein